jgi:carbonic anhydrase/acetyltransferase-like protein (isoleucine patch superfamily)
MIIANSKPIGIIGYQDSSMTQEFLNAIGPNYVVTVISPVAFLNNPTADYQYIVSVSIDFTEREKVIDLLDQNNLDLITIIHNTAIIGSGPAVTIGGGTFIFPFCNVGIGAKIGRHCIVGSYSLVGHYSGLGNNCILRPGVMISGKSTVGNNCVINTRATVTNQSIVTDSVEIMAFATIVKNINQPGRYMGRSKKIN